HAPEPGGRLHPRRRGRRRPPPEAELLDGYAASLTAHAATLEQLQGQKDVSAVDGFVDCAAIVGAILRERWQDEAPAMNLAARAVVLSRSFLREFLEASGGGAEGTDAADVVRRMCSRGRPSPRPD